jgi:hypothetical protein
LGLFILTRGKEDEEDVGKKPLALECDVLNAYSTSCMAVIDVTMYLDVLHLE